MALPRYLYSINNSMPTPLLNDQDSDDRSEQELVLSADTEPEVTELADEAGGSDKFTGEVRLSSPDLLEPKLKSDIYTSARLAAAGIPDPLTEERQLLGVSDDHVFHHGNPPGGEGFRKGYGTNDELPPFGRSRSRPLSTTCEFV